MCGKIIGKGAHRLGAFYYCNDCTPPPSLSNAIKEFRGAPFLLMLIMLAGMCYMTAASPLFYQNAYANITIYPEPVAYWEGSDWQYFKICDKGTAGTLYAAYIFDYPLKAKTAELNGTHEEYVEIAATRYIVNNATYGIASFTTLNSPPPRCDIGEINARNNKYINYTLTENSTQGFACLNSTRSLGGGNYIVGWWSEQKYMKEVLMNITGFYNINSKFTHKNFTGEYGGKEYVNANVYYADKYFDAGECVEYRIKYTADVRETDKKWDMALWVGGATCWQDDSCVFEALIDPTWEEQFKQRLRFNITAAATLDATEKVNQYIVINISAFAANYTPNAFQVREHIWNGSTYVDIPWYGNASRYSQTNDTWADCTSTSCYIHTIHNFTNMLNYTDILINNITAISAEPIQIWSPQLKTNYSGWKSSENFGFVIDMPAEVLKGADIGSPYPQIGANTLIQKGYTTLISEVVGGYAGIYEYMNATPVITCVFGCTGTMWSPTRAGTGSVIWWEGFNLNRHIDGCIRPVPSGNYSRFTTFPTVRRMYDSIDTTDRCNIATDENYSASWTWLWLTQGDAGNNIIRNICKMNALNHQEVNLYCINTNSSRKATITFNNSFLSPMAAPSVIINSPLNQSYNTSSILLNISSNGTSVWFSYNASNTSYTTPITINFADGAYIMRAWASNSDAESNATPVYFTVENLMTSVSLTSPTNSTYINATPRLNFTPYGTFKSYSCVKNIDGNVSSVGIVLNNTMHSEVLSVLGIGGHTIAVNCTNITEGTASITFSEAIYQSFAESYLALVNETELTTLNASMQLNTLITGSNASLWFNGTKHNATATALNAFTIVERVPLLTVNDSSISHRWELALTFLNGTTEYINQSELTQQAYMIYLLSNFTLNNTIYTEGDAIGANVSMVAPSPKLPIMNVSIVVHTQQAKASNATSYYFFTSAQTAPAITLGNQTFGVYASINVSYGGVSRIITSDNITITVISLNLTNCSDGGFPLYRFDLTDEENYSAVVGSQEATFTVWNGARTISKNYSLSNISSSFMYVCTPNNVPIWVDSVQKYYADDYSTRYYYLLNKAAVPSAGVEIIPLYLLNNTYSTPVVFTVQNQNAKVQGGAYVAAERYYPAENAWRVVGMGKTNDEGKVGIYLRVLSPTMRYKVYQNFSLMKTSTSAIVSCVIAPCSIVLTLGSGEFMGYLTWSGSIGHYCEYDNATGELACAFADSTGQSRSFTLTVQESSLARTTTVCNEKATGANGTLTCGGLNASTRYSYVLVFESSPPNTLESGILNAVKATDLGMFGRWLGFLLLIGIAGISLILPDVFLSGMFVALGVIVLAAMGLMVLSEITIGGFIVIAVLLAMKAAASRG